MKTIFDFLSADSLQVEKLLDIEWDITDGNNYWYKAGGNGILLVGHVDTIPRCDNPRFKDLIRPLKVSLDAAGKITADKSVLGADDRAGIYSIYTILQDPLFKDCSVLLTNYEESGGVGVKKFIKDFPDALKDYKFFLEFDRKGINEVVFYHTPNEGVLALLASHGFQEKIGIYSDVADLSAHYNIHHANVSVGYYNNHSPKEYLDYFALEFKLIPSYKKVILDLIQLPAFEIPAIDYFDDALRRNKVFRDTTQLDNDILALAEEWYNGTISLGLLQSLAATYGLTLGELLDDFEYLLGTP